MGPSYSILVRGESRGTYRLTDAQAAAPKRMAAFRYPVGVADCGSVSAKPAVV